MSSSLAFTTAAVCPVDETRMLLNAYEPADLGQDSPMEASCSAASSSGTVSGYASVASGRSCNSFEGTALPGHKLWLQKVEIKEYRREVPQPVRNRFEDLIELFHKPLRRCISKSQLGSRDISFQLKILGEDETSSRPFIFVQCDSRLSKKIKHFFKSETIKSQYDTTESDPLLPSFSIFICELPPRRIAATSIDVYGQSQSRVGFGSSSIPCSIKVMHVDETRFATIGGLVKVLLLDNTEVFYGMTAGHVFATNADDDGEDLSIELDSSSDDDENIISDDENDVELDLSSRQSSRSSTAPGFQDATWSKLGRLLEASKNTDQSRNFDWALVSIDDPLLCYNIIGKGPIYKLGEKGDVYDLSSSIGEASVEREVLLSGGTSGMKEGLLSTTWSYLNLEPGKSLIRTYMVKLSDETTLRDGDCGAWVIDKYTHEVFGHIVASSVFGEAYVVPLEDIFENIRMQLGSKSVSLPQSDEVITWLHDAQGKTPKLSQPQPKDNKQATELRPTPETPKLRHIERGTVTSPLTSKVGGYVVVERYSVCRCLYHKHSVDMTDAYGTPGSYIQEKTVLVGYACERHSASC